NLYELCSRTVYYIQYNNQIDKKRCEKFVEKFNFSIALITFCNHSPRHAASSCDRYIARHAAKQKQEHNSDHSAGENNQPERKHCRFMDIFYTVNRISTGQSFSNTPR